jgi:hypothetical protein
MGKYEITMQEQYANPKITQKMLDDSFFDVEGWLARKVANKMARTENTAYVNGNGILKPKGFLSYAARRQAVEGELEADRAAGHGTRGRVPGREPGGQDHRPDRAAEGRVPSGRRVRDEHHDRRCDAQAEGRTGQLPVLPELRERRRDSRPQPARSAAATRARARVSRSRARSSASRSTSCRTCRTWPPTRSRSSSRSGPSSTRSSTTPSGIRVLRDPYTGKPYVSYYTTKRTGGDVVNFEAAKILKFG